MTKIDTLVFDLDGTLLDTLDDLANSVNHALQTYGQPTRSRAEIRQFLGNGIRNLLQQSVAEGTDATRFEEILDCFRAHYVAHCLDATRPYPGIMPLLKTLKSRGYKLAIVSNKLHTAVQELNERFFKDYVTSAVGESATVRRKPCPDAVLAALKELHSEPSSAIYVGDSEVDIETSQNAGIPCLSVLWGFRDEDFLRQRYPTATFVHTPEEILDHL